MIPTELHLIVPGRLAQRTGGYLYDARIAQGLRTLGWRVVVHELSGRFPDADAAAEESLASTLAAIAPGRWVVIDGLAMGGLPGPLRAHQNRLRMVSLVHHLLADETGLEPAQQRRFLELERDALECCAGAVVTSNFTKSRLRALGLESDRVRAAPPGVDPARPARGPSRGEPPALLCVASVTPRKGQDLLVHALTRLADLPWRCVCAGALDRDPRYASSVQQLVSESGLAERVQFVGECEATELARLYDQASIFVLPSYFEGFGMVLTEALVRGLPIVATTGGAIPHTVPPDAGLFVAPGDDRALSDALRSVVPPGPRRQQLAAAARHHAKGLPGWDHAAQVFAGVLNELAGDGASAVTRG